MNYKIENSLASGSTSKVKKATCKNKQFAIKIMDKTKKTEKEFRKEVKLLSIINHKNIINIFDHYTDQKNYYLVMNLAETELFDLIEPEEGLNITLTHFYMKQLTSAVLYLHGLGIVHRDIKPENILLDEAGNLMLTDFGSATLYSVNGKKRRLRTIAGSYKYMAPDVLTQNYDNSVDIWSMGILLFEMVTGTQLWKEPTTKDIDYVHYIQMQNHDYHPFNKLSKPLLGLFKLMCTHKPQNRIKIQDLHNNEWISKKNILEDENGLCKDKTYLFDYISPKISNRISFSQPQHIKKCLHKSNFVASQPTTNIFDLPSLKRIYFANSKEEVFCELTNVLKSLIIPFTIENTSIYFSTVDKYNNELTGEIQVENLQETTCMSFTRFKGACMEYKSFFNTINECLIKKLS
ncbi:Chk1 protein kinase [Binucleata daphniae]